MRINQTIALSILLGPVFSLCANVPDYAQMPRSEVPEAFRWKIADLFPDRAAWEKEFAELRTRVDGLSPLMQGWTLSPARMADLLERVDEIQRRSNRLNAYAKLQADEDLAKTEFQKLKGQVQSFLVDFEAKLAFMNPDLLVLGQERTESFLKAEPRLAPFRVNLLRILRNKGHVLSQNEERIMSLTGDFSDAPGAAAKLLNNVDIPKPDYVLADGTKLRLDMSTFASHRSSPVRQDRLGLLETYWKNQKHFENTFATLLDANTKAHFFNAKVRNFPSCLDAALYEDAVEPKVYRNLITMVHANLAPLHRLIKLRARMLGVPDFRYSDIYASAVASVDKRFTYDQAQRLLLNAMKPLGTEYTTALANGLERRWVDVYPNKGKRFGAYSSDVYGVHPYVLLNYDGRYTEVSTLAHEMGHAMHTWFSQSSQPYAMADYPIFLAEVASTFNETMLMHQMLKSETDDTFKLYLLDCYLEQLRGTLYRQTLFAEFELACHERVEAGQSLTPDWLNAKYLELTRLYYGHDQGVMRVEDAIQSEWSGVHHFFYDFYVYKYATGIVASLALAEAVMKEGEPARARYMGFLKSGASKFPLDTLKDAGVDLTIAEPYTRAFQAFDRIVGEMESLVNRMEKRKTPK